MTDSSTYSRQRLSYVSTEVSRRLKSVKVSGLTPDYVPLLEASGAYVRGCWEAACGVMALATASERGGIVAAERQAWEMQNELDYLLRSADPPRNGVKVQVNALIEVIQLLTVSQISTEMLAHDEILLAEFETAHPQVVVEVRQQRKRKRYHWSGQGRTSIVAGTDLSRAVYKMLSWQAHPDICPIRDISTEDRNGVGYLLLTDPPDVDAAVERAASSTSECLLRAWNVFADYFGQATIDDAPPRKPR